MRRFWRPPVHSLDPSSKLAQRGIPVDTRGIPWDVLTTSRFISYACLALDSGFVELLSYYMSARIADSVNTLGVAEVGLIGYMLCFLAVLIFVELGANQLGPSESQINCGSCFKPGFGSQWDCICTALISARLMI